MLIDNLAVEAVNRLDYDFSKIEGIDSISNLGWIARCSHIDRTIREFITKRPNATVVNLGCGLDTAFWRVNDSTVNWFDLDLPNVIELRSKLLPKHAHVQSIASSAFDSKWFSYIKPAKTSS